MHFTALPGVEGIGEGEVFQYSRDYSSSGGAGGSNIKSWDDLLREANKELSFLKDRLKSNYKENDGSSILDVQIEILNDPALAEEAVSEIESGKGFSQVIIDLFSSWKSRISSIGDEYLKERVRDLEDLEERLLALVKGVKKEPPVLNRPIIMITNDLFPSELLSMDRKWIRGIILGNGSPTSHVVLLAKAFRIPVVIGAAGFCSNLHPGEYIRIYGGNGEVYQGVNGEFNVSTKDNMSCINGNTIDKKSVIIKGDLELAHTKDGVKIKLSANLDLIDDIHEIKKKGLKNIGLFRSEFLYISRGADFSIDDEVDAYIKLFKEFSHENIVVRLLDLGSDKFWPGLPLENEPNPALGERGIRLLIKERWLLERQLKAIFKAAASLKKKTPQPLSILIPMVSSVYEIEQVREVIGEILRGYPQIPFPKIGAMVEIPSMVFALSSFKGTVDFVSIGTNDLIQYSMAVDRLITSSSDNWLEPGMLHILHCAVKGARRAKIPLSVCGELAGTISGAMMLIGFGVRKLSMTQSQIPVIHDFISKIKVADCQSLAKKLLKSINKVESGTILHSYL